MANWLDLVNWDYLERISGWGPSAASGAFNESFDDPDQVRRAQTTCFSSYFDEQQAQALKLDAEESVVDVCCGVGRLTIPIAKRCKRVTGLDGSRLRLDAVEELAAQNALHNVSTLQADWFQVEPRKDTPVFDVAVACNCPVAIDLVKFSRIARKRCIYLQGFSGVIPSMITEGLYQGVRGENEDPTLRRWGTDDYRHTEKSTFYIAFNHLLSLGASPTVNYVDAGWHVEADNSDELCQMLLRGEHLDKQAYATFKRNAEKHISACDGGVVFERKHKMALLQWNPSEVQGWA